MESFRENVRAKLREIASGRSHGIKHLCWELGLLELGHSRANYLKIYEQISLTDKDSPITDKDSPKKSPKTKFYVLYLTFKVCVCIFSLKTLILRLDSDCYFYNAEICCLLNILGQHNWEMFPDIWGTVHVTWKISSQQAIDMRRWNSFMIPTGWILFQWC